MDFAINMSRLTALPALQRRLFNKAGWLLDQSVGTNSRQKHCADEGVALKKSAIDPSHIEMTRAPMLVNKRDGYEWHPEVINWPKLGSKAESNESAEHGSVQQLSQTQA